MSDKKAYTTLRRAPMFQSLSDDEVRDLASICVADLFCAGAWLFRAGDRGNGMWIIASGGVDILLDGGHDAPLAHLGPSDVLGELSLIEPDLRSASARASADTCAYRIDFAAFAERRDQLDPAATKLLRALSTLVCVRIRHVNARIEGIAKQSDDRVAQLSRKKTITDVLSKLWSGVTHG